MQRSPTILLCLLAAGSALAQSDPQPSSEPAPASAPDASSTAAATATADAAAAEKKAEEEKKDEPVNARLAPGGVVAGGNSFPLHVQLTLDNSLGNAIFAPGFQNQVTWGTALSVRMSAMLPKADFLPRMLLSGGTDFSVANWVPASTNFTAYDGQIQVGDASLALILPGIYREEFTGIGVSLIASGRAPLSLGSRRQNLIFSGAAAAQFMWGSPETPIGSFFVQYTPSARASAYSQPGATTPCSAATPFRTTSTSDPIDGITELPVYFGREEQVLENGDCILPGRQALASISNSAATGWSTPDGSHNVTATFGWSHAFLRPLKSSPELSSVFASGQNFSESTSGSLSYTYTVPVDFNLFITAGAFSQQPSYNDQGGLRLPWWDFVTPANNLSAFFLDVTVGI